MVFICPHMTHICPPMTKRINVMGGHQGDILENIYYLNSQDISNEYNCKYIFIGVSSDNNYKLSQ